MQAIQIFPTKLSIFQLAHPNLDLHFIKKQLLKNVLSKKTTSGFPSSAQVVLGLQWQFGPEFPSLSNEIIVQCHIALHSDGNLSSPGCYC